MLKVRLASRRKSSAGKPLQNWGGKVLGEDRGVVHRAAFGGRHVPVCRPGLAAGRRWKSSTPTCHGLRRRPEGAILSGRQVSAFDLSRLERVRRCWPSHQAGAACRNRCATGSTFSAAKSVLPRAGEMLVETFPRGRQELPGVLPVRRAAGAPDAGHAADPAAGAGWACGPLGFVASDYALSVWCLRDMSLMPSRQDSCRSAQLFDEDMLGDDLDAWLDESMLMKRTFRNCAIIAGLIERAGRDRRSRAGR
jgi:hypothetical protein